MTGKRKGTTSTKAGKPKKSATSPPPAPAVQPLPVDGDLALGVALGVEGEPGTEDLESVQNQAAVQGAHSPGSYLADTFRLPRLPPAVAIGMTAKQIRFAYAWFESQSAIQAARDAGYGPNAQRTAAHVLMRHVRIKKAIDWLLDQLEAQNKLGAPWVLARLTELHDVATARTPILDKKGIPTGEYRVDGPTAARCLELIGKHFGMFGQQVTVTRRTELHVLMETISARGKPSLEARTIDSTAQRVIPQPSDKTH